MTVFEKIPQLAQCKADFDKALAMLIDTYTKGGRVYICGNGGSDADSRHIVGELMKSFEVKRPVKLDNKLATKLTPKTAALLGSKLQGVLPAHSLSSETSLLTAIINDVSAEIVFAQQVYGYGKAGDALICLSTSGNSQNICLAAELAQAMGLGTIAFTGRTGGKLGTLCDISICVPADTTADIQEYHLPLYHLLCRELERWFFACSIVD